MARGHWLVASEPLGPKPVLEAFTEILFAKEKWRENVRLLPLLFLLLLTSLG